MFQIIADNCLWKWIFFLTWKGHCTSRETFFFQIMNTCTPARQRELYSSQLDFLPRFLQYIMVNHYWNGFTIGWNQLWRRIIIKRDLARALLRMWFVVLSLSLLWSKIQFITTKSWQKHQFLSYSNILLIFAKNS